MRILMTQRALIHRGGTEMVTIEVAKELAERGHEMAVYSPRVGEISQIVLSSGVSVHTQLADVPWAPDIIHGHHHLQTMAALARFQEARTVYCCHGFLPWVEHPPAHRRIARYVMMCEWLAARVKTEFGIPESKVAVVPNFVNLKRFSRVRTPPERPVRAVLFGGATLLPAEMEKLESACKNCGLSLDRVGYSHGNPNDRPEVFLQDYDVAFAIGKCALEAMACGCAVIPLLPGQAGRLITTETLDEYAFSNFSPRYFTSADQIDEAWLRTQTNLYHRDDVTQVTATVRGRYSLPSAVDRLVDCYERVMREPLPDAPSGPDGELAAYLEKMGGEMDVIWGELEVARGRLKKTTADSKRFRQELGDAQKRAGRYVSLKLRHDLTLQTLRDNIAGRWVLKRISRMLRHLPPP
ncbi:MAG TPA: glycosyltransferase, partial [Candidatus Saccharimonadia bacterium]|nr:glycosyltransferase [Candidatus Saccharimonadia bacterium]